MPWRSRLAILLLGVMIAGPVLAEVLEGRVVEDHTGRPLPSAEVRVRRIGASALVADLGTNRDGRFQAPDLPTGEYGIEISKVGYVGATMRVRLPAPLLQLRLVRLGSIAGRVNDADGRPLQGARVYLLVKPESGGALQPLKSTEVDGGGQYRLYDLRPGQYAAAVSFASSGSGFLIYPDTARPRFFSVTGGEEYSGIDFVRFPASTYRVSGSVISPVAGSTATISLLSVDQPAFPIATARTDADRSFHLEGVPAGSYDLVASGPTGASSSQGALLRGDPFYGRIHVEVAGGDVEGLVVPVGKGRSVSFVLRAKGPRGTRACSQNATLAVTPLEALGSLDRRTIEAGLDKAGTLDDLSPGRYQVGILKIAEGCYVASLPVVDLSAGNLPGPVEIVVAPAGSILGLLHAGSAKSSDFVVALMASEPSGAEQSIQIAYPDEQFRFSFAGLRPGRYRMAAQRIAETPKTRWIADLSQMLEVDVSGGTTTDVDLSPLPSTDDAVAR